LINPEFVTITYSKGDILSQALIKKIRNELKKKSRTQLAVALGYRSESSLEYWIKKGKVPKVAEARVEKYFAKRG
jgi:hypothetical protein